MIGGSFYPETIGLANLAASNAGAAPRRILATEPQAGGPDAAWLGYLSSALNSV